MDDGRGAMDDGRGAVLTAGTLAGGTLGATGR
jgi:hypothetical protein